MGCPASPRRQGNGPRRGRGPRRAAPTRGRGPAAGRARAISASWRRFISPEAAPVTRRRGGRGIPLKANPRTAAIPVLVMTAYGGDQNLRDLLLELGAVDVLEKPVDLAIAFNKAERLVQRDR